MSWITVCRSFAAMGLYPNDPMIRVDAILIDSGCNYLSTIGDRIVESAQYASIEKTAPRYTKKTQHYVTKLRAKQIGK